MPEHGMLPYCGYNDEKTEIGYKNYTLGNCWNDVASLTVQS